MSFELSATNLTDTSVSLVMTLTSDYESDATISFSFQQGGSSGQTVYATSATIPSGSHTGDNITTNVDNQLTASTTYYVAATSGGALLDDVTITTKATGYNDPRTATQEQWEDLATRVKAKADSSNLSTVATSGSYDDLSDKPAVPTITMSISDPGEGAPLAENNYIGVYGGDPIIMDYSISEINTGAKWIDGSPIYKKTIDCGTLPNDATKDIPYNISDFSRLLKLEGYTYNSTDNQFYYIPHASALTINNSISAWIEGSNIRLRTGVDRTNCTETYITLYYTKSS